MLPLYREVQCRRYVERVATLVYPGPDFRVTLFARADTSVIRPWLRYDRSLQVATPIHRHGVQFEKRQSVAGQAWAEPRVAFLLPVPAGTSTSQFTDFFRTRGVTDEVARELAKSPDMRRCRGILCLGLPGDYGLVLSVDTFVPDGLGSVRADGTLEVRNEEALRREAILFGRVISEWMLADNAAEEQEARS